MPRSTILVVDDESVITQTIVLILNRFEDEFLGIGSTNVSEALTIVRAIHPDLVLLDAIMPGTNGLQHAIEMRENYGCNVLIVSGRADTADLLEDLNREGHERFEVLAKPVHPNDLVAKIREMLQRTPRLSTRRHSSPFGAN
jgi:DNA-binding response OmpR family regulator